jgi:hypothetical protein
MDPGSLSPPPRPTQGHSWRRTRRCLLKGCGRWFQPTHPRCRYCSTACRKAARMWHNWQAQQRYRATADGRRQRQQQASRYRQRCQTRAQPPPSTAAAAIEPARTLDASGEGKHIGQKSAAGVLHLCARPGCYEQYAAAVTCPQQRFCCALCRQALCCVEQREKRYQRRRQRGLRAPGRKRRRSPRGP